MFYHTSWKLLRCDPLLNWTTFLTEKIWQVRNEIPRNWSRKSVNSGCHCQKGGRGLKEFCNETKNLKKFAAERYVWIVKMLTIILSGFVDRLVPSWNIFTIDRLSLLQDSRSGKLLTKKKILSNIAQKTTSVVHHPASRATVSAESFNRLSGQPVGGILFC